MHMTQVHVSGSGGGDVQQFETKEYDITDTGMQCCCVGTLGCCSLLCLCPGVMGSKKLIMGPDNLVMDFDCACCTSKSEIPYSDLGGVERNNCLCCSGISGLGTGSSKDQPLFPGWGCSGNLVDEIVAEIKLRAGGRGAQGQLEVAQTTLTEVRQLRADLDEVKLCMQAIMEHHRIQPPAGALTMGR